MRVKYFLLPFLLMIFLSTPRLIRAEYYSDPVGDMERLLEEMRQNDEEREKERKEREEKRKEEMRKTQEQIQNQLNQQMLNQQLQNNWNMINNNIFLTNMILIERIKRKEDCVAQNGEWKENKCYIPEIPKPSTEPMPEPVYNPSPVIESSPSPSPSPATIEPGPPLVLNYKNKNIILMHNISNFIEKIVNSFKFPQLFKIF